MSYTSSLISHLFTLHLSFSLLNHPTQHSSPSRCPANTCLPRSSPRSLTTVSQFRNASVNVLWVLVADELGPAMKVPGLIFCAGQTAKGDIKEATVSSAVYKAGKMPLEQKGRQRVGMRSEAELSTDHLSPKLAKGSRTRRLLVGEGRQVQRLPRRHGRLCRDERGIHRCEYHTVFT